MARSIEQLPDLVSVLAHHSAAVPERDAYIFLPRGTGPGASLSYRELDRRSGRLVSVKGDGDSDAVFELVVDVIDARWEHRR